MQFPGISQDCHNRYVWGEVQVGLDNKSICQHCDIPWRWSESSATPNRSRCQQCSAGLQHFHPMNPQGAQSRTECLMISFWWYSHPDALQLYSPKCRVHCHWFLWHGMAPLGLELDSPVPSRGMGLLKIMLCEPRWEGRKLDLAHVCHCKIWNGDTFI